MPEIAGKPEVAKSKEKKRLSFLFERSQFVPEVGWGLDLRVHKSFQQSREFLSAWERRGIRALVYASHGAVIASMTIIVLDVFNNAALGALPKALFQLAILAGWLLIGFFTLRLSSFHHLTAKNPLPDLQELARVMDKNQPVTIVIPAYKEPLEVLARSLYSVVLQNYPQKNLVLLIDNLPAQTIDEIGLIEKISSGLKKLDSFLDEVEKQGRVAGVMEAYSCLDRYLQDIAEKISQLPNSHHQKQIERFLEDTRLHLKEISAAFSNFKEQIDGHPQQIARALKPLRRITETRISFFSRKTWSNLSHARTKAHNLNVFLNLFGKPVRELAVNGEKHLVVDGVHGTIRFPKTEYICFLDADTNIAPDYLLNLVSMMERAENTNVAIAQTMCQYEYESTNPIAVNSAAEFDIASLALRGFAADNLAFWVGTNGVARFDLLERVSIVDGERRTYIHDKTVTEDAETSVALWRAGYEILTYPEIMGWSLGPTDVGSLASQRERWNIGVLIHIVNTLSGDVRKKVRRSLVFTCPAAIAFLYLSSLVAVEVVQDMPILAVVPGLAALVIMGYFLHKLGYGYHRLFHFVGHQLFVIPAYLMGIVKTLVQMITGRKSDYARTSRIAGETLLPMIYQLVYALVAFNLVWGLTGQTGTDGVQQVLQGLSLASFLYLAHADSQGKNIFLLPFKRALSLIGRRSVSTGESLIPKN